MKRRRRRRASALFSFSFLDVFACTLGVLIFILATSALQGQGVGLAAAEASSNELARLEEQLAALAAAKSEAPDDWQREALEERLADSVASLAAVEARDQEIAEREAALAWDWGRLPTKVGENIPIYLECKDGKVWLQPDGIAEDPKSLAKIKAVLEGLKGDAVRYPVLILRSSGYEAYSKVVEQCERLGIDFAREPLPDSLKIEGWQ